MSITILNQSHELGFVQCYLKHSEHPLAILSFRQYFVSYHLNPESPDAFFGGDVVNDEVLYAAAVTIRSRELIVKSLLGISTPDQLVKVLTLCKGLALTGDHKRVIHLVIARSLCDTIVDFDKLELAGLKGTFTVLKAGDRPASKAFWWSTMNRQVESKDMAFIRLEF
jgi:hypothetical protein